MIAGPTAAASETAPGLLEKGLRPPGKYEPVIIEGLDYVPQNRDEMEVLFTLLAHRNESHIVVDQQLGGLKLPSDSELLYACRKGDFERPLPEMEITEEQRLS